MTAIVITIYCLLAVLLIFGVTFRRELLDEEAHKKKGGLTNQHR
jgi:hypothetical protein